MLLSSRGPFPLPLSRPAPPRRAIIPSMPTGAGAAPDPQNQEGCAGPDRRSGRAGGARLPGRSALALVAGRLTAVVLRRFGRGATTLPGRVALRLDPRLPGRLASRLPHGACVISGTNGKTTTSAMLAAILARRGWRLAHNRGGANLRTGITTALLLGVGRGADAALLEVDEATMPFAGRELRPRLALVTNFFRDQLDRYGELETAVALVGRGLAALPAGARAVVNADDPLAASIGGRDHLRQVYFGLDPAVLPAEEVGAGPSDAPRCPRCGALLLYGPRYYAHLGVYRCGGCGFSRPRPDVLATGWAPGAAGRPGEVTLRIPAGTIAFPLALPGLYNVYNAAAAAAAALALGTDAADVAGAMGAFRHAFGRMEWLELAGHPACLALVKNPAGCSMVLRTASADPVPGKALVLLLNDRYADGTDVSWIWDADFEALAAAQEGFAAVVAGGRRAADMALRLKYAGVAPKRLAVHSEPEAAMAAAARAAAPGSGVYILPTYSAMLEARAVLVRQGRLQPFWEA